MALAGAQVETLNWMDALGAADAALPIPGAQDLARSAFASITNPETSAAVQRCDLLALRAPTAVRHLVGLLGAYDWDFVEQAKKMRSYAVAKIMEETTHTDARIRLKALDMLGKITEIGLYTEKIEVKHITASTEELEASIRERLSKYLPKEMQPTQDVSEAVIVDEDPPAPAPTFAPTVEAPNAA